LTISPGIDTQDVTDLGMIGSIVHVPGCDHSSCSSKTLTLSALHTTVHNNSL